MSANAKLMDTIPPSEPSPSRLRLLRFVTLCALLLSDGTYTVLRRFSRGVLLETYSVNEVLMGAEFIKLAFSCYMMSGGVGLARLTNLLLRSKKMLILAAIYGLGNVLSYYALARVGEYFRDILILSEIYHFYLICAHVLFINNSIS